MSNRTLLLLMGLVALFILIAGVVGVVAIAGGGGDDSTSPASSGTSTNGSPGASPKATAGGTKSASSGGGGSLGKLCQGKTIFVVGSDPSSLLDPIQTEDDVTSQYILEIYSGLVTLDQNLKVQPDIAKSWDISPDGKTYTFHLKDNVVFHNSKRVTAHDFKYSWERAADPANASPTVVAYLGDVVGVKDKYSGKAKEVSGVKDIDDTTLQVTLSDPADYFLAELTYPVSYVVDKDQIDKDPRNWTRKPNGTGPFKLAEFTPSQKIRLVKNDRYQLGAPKLDEVDYDLSSGSVPTRYENNEIHIGFVPASELDAVKNGSSPLAKDYHPVPQLAVGFISVNPNKAPFDDPNVRQAFAMSIDRQSINHALFFDAYTVADGIVPPNMPGYTESVHAYPYDPAKAKQLIQQSKYAGNMPKITLTLGGGTTNPGDELVAIQQAWKDSLGIDVQLQTLDLASYLREYRRGNFQMIDGGWIADYPDIENFLGKLFASDSQLNHSQYKNKDVDTFLQQARRETDSQTRYKEYAQAEQKILDDVAVIPTFWPTDHTLVKSCVKGYPDVATDIAKWRYVDIDNTK